MSGFMVGDLPEGMVEEVVVGVALREDLVPGLFLFDVAEAGYRRVAEEMPLVALSIR